MRALIAWSLKWWLWLALATSAGLLAIAHAFQTFGGLMPCELCLKQRDVYWAALAIAAAAIAARAIAPTRRSIAPPLLGLILAAAFAIGCGIAVYQAGAEWKWWPGPESCSGGSLSAGAIDLKRFLASGPVHVVRCDEASWRFLGLSMAGWNALISLKMTGWTLAWAGWSRNHD
jgi:disulfide bond formation protein DsbB